MPAFSGQQTTHLQRTSNGITTPILRSSNEYAPAPASGGGLSELASLRATRSSSLSSSSVAQAQAQAQQHQTKANGYNISSVSVSRSTASVLSPRVNPSISRSVPIDTDAVLPLIHKIKNDSAADEAPQKPTRTSIMRAAEGGKGNLLPIRGTPTSIFRQPQQQQNQRTRRQAPARSNSSGPSYSTGLPRTRHDLVDGNARPRKSSGGKSKLAYLRRRTATSSDDEFEISSQRNRRDYKSSDGGGHQSDAYLHSRGGNRRQMQNSAMSVTSTGSVGGNSMNGSSSREHHNPLRWSSGFLCKHQLLRLSRMKLGHLLQVVIVLAVIALVYESHHKALFATQQLTQFKEEESLLLLHLQKIEQQSIQLHEILGRFARVAISGGNNDAAGNGENSVETGGGDAPQAGGGAKPPLNGANSGGARAVDFDLIHKQTQQLYQMEQELSDEVDTLQKRIQLSARNHLIREFGEGPVQVQLEMDFGDPSANAGPRVITILLWLDTPHAAWTWLEQIGNNLWDGAEFKWEQGHVIDAYPPEDRIDPQRDGKIEFVERSQHAHQPWTVGVREQLNHANGVSRGGSMMSMYINLQDNSQLNKHETCVGKVIDGFDALQQLLELSRKNGGGKDAANQVRSSKSSSSSSSISIRKATAMHYVTKKAGMGK